MDTAITLPTVAYSTARMHRIASMLQEIGHHFRKQGAFGTEHRNGTKCVYSSTWDNGTSVKCAIGCLLSDRAMELEPNSCGVRDLSSTTHGELYERMECCGLRWETLDAVMVTQWREFLCTIQSVHDSLSVTCWRNEPEPEESAHFYDLRLAQFIFIMLEAGEVINYAALHNKTIAYTHRPDGYALLGENAKLLDRLIESAMVCCLKH
jgi:hypothetical protein